VTFDSCAIVTVNTAVILYLLPSSVFQVVKAPSSIAVSKQVRFYNGPILMPEAIFNNYSQDKTWEAKYFHLSDEVVRSENIYLDRLPIVIQSH
jgi:hypothetical protein